VTKGLHNPIFSVPMKAVVILNGTPSKRERYFSKYRYYLEKAGFTDLRITEHPNHAAELAKQAVKENPQALFAAGGDGTLNQVLNGLMASGNHDVALGIIPLGTGNDFARMAGILQPDNLIRAINAGPRLTDIGSITGLDSNGVLTKRYFINVSSIGMGPDVVRRLATDSRNLGPALTYLRATLRSFFGYQPETVTASTENWNWSGRIRALAVANGRTFGNQLLVGPDASVNDGLFSTFLAGDVSLPVFLRLLMSIRSGKKISHPQAWYNTCETLRVESREEVWAETDGELAVKLPAEFRIHPGAIRFFRNN
jgi:YegS/Rv2252/BmrU family lipid kinase